MGRVEYSIGKLTARVVALINRSDPTLIDIFRRCVHDCMWAQAITASPSLNCHRAKGTNWARASRGQSIILPLVWQVSSSLPTEWHLVYETQMKKQLIHLVPF